MTDKTTWTQGETFTLTFTLTTDGTTAVDTNSANFEFKVESAAGTELLSLDEADSQITVGGGGSSNVVTVGLGTTDTNITAGRHTYQAKITVSSEVQIYQGTCVVVEAL